MNNIEKRLGILIGILRKKKLKAGNPAFKQESFIKSNDFSRFEGVELNHTVCSLATLSRIENGKHQHDYQLLDFFLKKLDIHYRIKESLQIQESEFLQRISIGFVEDNIDELKTIVGEFIEFCNLNSNDVLIQLDQQGFEFIIACLSNQPISRRTYDNLINQFEVFNPIIKNWLISCAYLLKRTHPDFWSIEKPNTIPDLIKLCLIELHRIKLDVYSVHQSSLKAESLNVNSLAYEYLMEIALLDDTGHKPKGLYAKELNLCIKLAARETVNEKGSSLLFNVLDYFNGIKNPEVQLAYFTDKISDLLRSEPYPQQVTKLMGQRILLLCQETKTYKPLVNIVDLLSENNSVSKTLIQRFD
jgi:transcriptional regulator with XRE-family HTH domain